MARPRKIIDWTLVDKLIAIQCTEEEIAGTLDISVDTLARACKREKKKSFAEYFGQKRGAGKISLRRHLWNAAMGVDDKGRATNTAALIFACKSMLGLREYDDRPPTQQPVTVKTVVTIRFPDGSNPGDAFQDPTANKV